MFALCLIVSLCGKFLFIEICFVESVQILIDVGDLYAFVL